MMPLTFGQVQEWTGGQGQNLTVDDPVRRLSIDSRETGPGVLFVALPGTRTDGHVFVEEVWRAGATALVERNFAGQAGPAIRVSSPLRAMGQLMRRYIDERAITVVGVTGSVGKTSVKELCAAVLGTRYVTSSSLGNYNTVIGLPLSFFAGDPRATHFVAEMGMRGAGEIRGLTEIAPPDVAVISTIGSSHLESMGSMEAIQRAKGEILEGLKPSGLAVLNYDNAWVRELGESTPRRVAWFGRSDAADGKLVSAQVEDDGTRIHIEIYGRPIEIKLPWLGVHHAYNVAAALLVGHELGINPESAGKGIAAIDQNRSRIHVLRLGDVTLLEDVYNSSPLSVKAALDVLAGRAGRRIAVIGDMLELGSEEAEGHRAVGAYAAGTADLLLAVGSRSRDTFAAAEAAGMTAAWVSSRQEAAEWLFRELRPGDVVLLKASRGLAFEWLTERLKEWGERR